MPKVSARPVALASSGGERVGNLLCAVCGANEHDRCAARYNQAEVACLVRDLVGVLGVAEILLHVIEHEVRNSIMAFEDSLDLPASGELHLDRLVEIPFKVKHGLVGVSFLAIPATFSGWQPQEHTSGGTLCPKAAAKS
eukprot:CAMPEP_0115483038 /NCGR_PEP_ID=MMETSP0271-20121206/58646_1 /TAXON_ID=71861 /ORGANISM="Scrippsiella trochoidea, Strain CCMP3099" /LENGTH=138 /DNA_ID=CAMNT_0002910869 /DNA_START=140 /DNA_END=557 /DNA_ORIENTATION=+